MLGTTDAPEPMLETTAEPGLKRKASSTLSSILNRFSSGNLLEKWSSKNLLGGLDMGAWFHNLSNDTEEGPEPTTTGSLDTPDTSKPRPRKNGLRWTHHQSQ